MKHTLIGAVLLVWIASLSFGQESLRDRLLPLIERHQGDVAVAVKHLETGDHFEHDADAVMPTASLIKVAVMVEAYAQADAGKIDLTKRITLREEDKVQGSGILSPHFSAGVQLPLRDAVQLMVAFSDNTATNLVLDVIGLKAVSDRMAALGLPDTRIHAKVFRPETSIAPDRSRQFGLGSTTAAEMLSLFEKLHRRELVSMAASEAMLSHLRDCQDRTLLPRFLPDDVKLAQKTGSVTAARCAAGILETEVGPIALCVLTNNNQDKRWSDENAANLLISKLTKEVFNHFQSTVKETPTKSEPLKQGASGQLVEALQRSLNSKLKLSPELTIDGDFGNATHAAVLKFQKENKLSANGVVDEAMWRLLGPLSVEPTPVGEPETVNTESLPKSPPDALDGPPIVTSKAWAIGNARTGELLWSHSDTDKLDMASTTKIMTAYLVLNLSEKEPSVLDETVTFSKRADRTTGTTSGVHAGEKLSVKELLYGLMLPSGNDAAIALAEHFGGRVKTGDGKDDGSKKAAAKQDSLAAFVVEMNRAAAGLGLQETRFKNPHGLTEVGHQTSARDLLKLSCCAMQNSTFREIVSTRQHGCQVTGPGGYKRNIKWKNTNELLDIEGFEGVKTGTTDAAGACLVSKASRGDESLMLVVLGSSSSRARYADTRNLFRWSWQQRAAMSNK